MNVTKITRALAVAAATLTLGTSSAFASIIGDSVNVTYYFPSSSNVYQDLGTQTISSSGDTYAFSPYFDLLITDNQFKVIFKTTTSWTVAPFNGFVVKDLTKNFSAPYVLDSATNMAGLTNSRITFGGNTVSVNWNGLAFNPTTSVVLDTAVPEPTTVVLLGIGLLGVASFRRKSVKSNNA